MSNNVIASAMAKINGNKKRPVTPSLFVEVLGYQKDSNEQILMKARDAFNKSVEYVVGMRHSGNEETENKKFKMENFSATDHKGYLPAGSIARLDHFETVGDNRLNATLVRRVSVSGTDTASKTQIIRAFARPLPMAQNASHAGVDIISSDNVVVKDATSFILESVKFGSRENVYDSFAGMRALYITDSPTAKPIRILIREVQDEHGNYRKPNMKEVKDLLKGNENFVKITTLINAGEIKQLNLAFGYRLLVNKKAVAEREYVNALKNANAPFIVSAIDKESGKPALVTENQYGFMEFNITTYDGFVSGIHKADKALPKLNQLPESITTINEHRVSQRAEIASGAVKGAVLSGAERAAKALEAAVSKVYAPAPIIQAAPASEEMPVLDDQGQLYIPDEEEFNTENYGDYAEYMEYEYAAAPTHQPPGQSTEESVQLRQTDTVAKNSENNFSTSEMKSRFQITEDQDDMSAFFKDDEGPRESSSMNMG